MAKTSHSQGRGPSSIPDQGTRSHMPKLTTGTAKYINIFLKIRIIFYSSQIPHNTKIEEGKKKWGVGKRAKIFHNCS